MKDILLNHVHKAYGNHPVLEDLTVSFPAGTLTCVQGASGVGKTTLLRLLAGLETPDAGTLEGLPDRIALMFQEDRLSEDFTAIRNVRLVTGKTVPEETIRAHLEETGLTGDCLAQPVREFSGGMKRRVAIVRTVCYGADLVLLDEPFKGLDEALRIQVMDYVKRRTAGKTVICVTHEAAEAAWLGGRLFRLEPSAKRREDPEYFGAIPF